MLLGIPFLAACGGGGGGGSDAGGSSNSFFLTDVKYGRLIEEDSGSRLVSPLTTVEIDAITGRIVPGSLQALAVGVEVNVPQSFAIGLDYLPIVVPRNGVLQLEFSAAIAPGSVFADVIDADGTVLSDGSVQVRTQNGRGVPVTLLQPSPNVIWIDPVTPSSVGLPASPIDFGPDGQPRADATGFLRLILPKIGPTVLNSLHGATLGSRVDKLGDPATAIGFNPGNRVLDFIAQNQLIPNGETFNGFLPDIKAPRVQRTLVYSKALSFAAGDDSSASSITDVAAAFSTAAKFGLGEWAGARLTLRPGLATEETHVVLSNTATVVTIADTFTANPRDGDTYRLERAEFFEPDPLNPIDPTTYDVNDPENSNNGDFGRFVDAFEIDEHGNTLSGPLPLSSPVPPFSELRMHFSEPIATESVSAYEDFQVRTDPDQGPGSEILSQALLDPTQRTVILRPALEDPASGTFRIVGWSKSAKTLRLQLKIVPKGSYLQQRMTVEAVQTFIELGERGVTDLGGQPIAFPDSVFDAADPTVTYSVPFLSDPTKSTQIPPPTLESWGVVVHRMQGRPLTGIDPATGLPGVKFVDQTNFYTPIADVNLQANGYLAGSPVVFITKIHDDFFPPPHGQFGAAPLGVGTPLTSFGGTPGVPQPHDGARFQTVYRDIDCSPNRDALAGTLLDLYRLSWAPIGGNVTTDTYADVSVHCAHSSYRPMTTQNGGYTSFPQSGLGQPFDFAAWQSLVDPNTADACVFGCGNNEGPNYWDALVAVVPAGTTYKITQSSLFTPLFDSHPYCPWPAFTTNFQYNNGDIPKAEKELRKAVNGQFSCGGAPAWGERRFFSSDPDQDNLGGDSMLVEIRIRPQTTNVSFSNGFTFAIGVLLAPTPNFRLFSLGSPGKVVNPDNLNQTAARCGIGNTTNPNQTIGDNSRYFAAFDYVKTTSVITSPFVRVFPPATTTPDYFAPVVQPPLSEQPLGTQVKLEFEGANNVKGSGPTGFSDSVDIADGRPNIAFRATFVGNVQTLLLPNFDLIAIPYLKPQGD